MHKPMTKEELEAREDITPEDKQLIEEAIGHDTEAGEETIKHKALRGYLVQFWEHHWVPARLRESLGMTAANWSDGWEYCLTYGGKQ